MKMYSPEFYLLILMSLDSEPSGRYQLSEDLGISQSKIRTMLNQLISKGLAIAGKGRFGTQLTSKGTEIVNKIKTSILIDFNNSYLNHNSDFINSYAFYTSVMIKTDELTTSGLYERDIAVRAGAAGAITLIKKGDWVIPPDNTKDSDLEILNDQVHNYTHIVICFGSTKSYTIRACGAISSYYASDEIDANLVDLS
jgi:predicted transcriptional regulator